MFRLASQRPARTSLAIVLLLAVSPWGTTRRVLADQEQQLFISLVDQNGTPVTDLRPDGVTVLEDGIARETVKIEAITWPMKLTVMVDNSRNPPDRLLQLRNGLREFFQAIPGDVEASLLTLVPQPRFVVRPTTDRYQLLKGVDLIAPDDGAPKFFDALVEAGERIGKEKSNHFPVIMMVATDGPEGSAVRENLFVRLTNRIVQHAVTVHVIMQSLGGQRSLGTTGAVQVDVGIRVTELSGGRYENIAASTRLATLLPEFGQIIARSHRRQSQQYLITYERPRGAGLPKQGITATTTRPGVSGIMTIDGRIPQP